MATAKNLSLNINSPLIFISSSTTKNLSDSKTRNILIIGNSGVGKSNFINHLVGCEVCKSKDSLYSVTKDVTVIEALLNQSASPICLTDTIGLDECDYNKTNLWNHIKDKTTAIHEVWLLISAKEKFFPYMEKHLEKIVELFKKNNALYRFKIIINKMDKNLKKE